MINPQDKSKLKKHENNVSSGQNQKAILSALQVALQKPVEQRYNQEQHAISQFMQRSSFFNELSELVSPDFARNIIRKSKVYCVQGRKKLYLRGQKMNIIFMPLMGPIYIHRYPSDIIEEPKTLRSTYTNFVRNANQINIPRGNMAFEKRVSIRQLEINTTAVPKWEQLTDLEQIKEEGTLMLGDLQREKYVEDIYVKGEGWFLGIHARFFRQCLLDQYNRLIMEQAVYFRKLRCFDMLADDELKIFIQKISLIEYKKDEYIFHEGDKSQYLYLLVEGQAKASKEAQLFKQDPNSLYRRTVKSQGSKRSERTSRTADLSYVNFEGVYNYSPQKRRIQLSIISPITIFGEEQVSGQIPRQADIQVTSTKVKLYRFTLKELESSGNGRKIDIQKFISNLFDATTSKRIMTRRQSLRTSLEFQNKRNMNYFFQDPSSPPQKKSVRIFKDRINSFIKPEKTAKSESEVKPQYHSFNFNQFLQGSNLIKKRGVQLSQKEKRIADLTHNSSEIVDQVSNQSKLYTRMKSYKHKINIVTPLFDSSYYKKQRKQVLRVENKRRMHMIEVKGLKEKKKSKQIEV